MKRRTRIVILSSVGCLLAVFSVPATRIASQRYFATGHICFWTEAARASERRHDAHSQLLYRAGSHHAFIDLIEVGDKSSVPVLIRSMRSAEAVAAYAHDDYICIWSHCLEAIQTITGEDFGTDADAWQNWWETTGSKMPDKAFFHKSKRRANKNLEPISGSQ